MSKVLEVKNVSKDYGDFKLKNVSFSLEKGYIMGLIGPNGSGKTTTIKLIMNLLSKDSGEIKMFNKDHIADEVKIKEKIGFVYDGDIYPSGMKLEKIAKLIAPFYKSWDQHIFEGYIKKFRLNLGKKLEDLSKGMKIKFSIAMALSHKPELILMDEPTSGLDPVFRREFLELLQDIIEKRKASVIFSTHITSDLEKVADYITFIDDGEVVFTDTYCDLVENYRLVKGKKEVLNNHKDTLIGMKVNKFGIEGLAKSDSCHTLTENEGVLLERPSLEDIMYYVSTRD
ncbi:ABC transporter ATP-binding protein [Proteinivorax hydrogeniformans]|uniref:ABC transporter ATP-binding protein n=1 Tax=Proteinivorax hydrogeniformans TaxID=1826727 RepID=A0AAU8HRL7_9FIRM